MSITYKQLAKDFPDDVNCGFCGEKNDWDEDGFFYLAPDPGMDIGDAKAACKKCRKGSPGVKHDRLHGIGDR